MNATSTGKAKPVTSLIAETTAAALTTATATSQGRSFVSAMTAGKVGASCRSFADAKKPS